jgi:hypothetical protein
MSGHQGMKGILYPSWYITNSSTHAPTSHISPPTTVTTAIKECLCSRSGDARTRTRARRRRARLLRRQRPRRGGTRAQSRRCDAQLRRVRGCRVVWGEVRDCWRGRLRVQGRGVRAEVGHFEPRVVVRGTAGAYNISVASAIRIRLCTVVLIDPRYARPDATERNVKDQLLRCELRR